MKNRLVIVDDAPFIREVLRHIFENTEIEVVGEAGDGEEAVEMVAKHKPDIVVMDIVMPRKSGIDATLEILKLHPGTKIVACSTVEENAVILRALDAGCADYVAKPFKADEVLKVVRRVLEKQGKGNAK